MTPARKILVTPLFKEQKMRLRFALFLLAFFLAGPFSYAEEVKRLEDETLENFARRNGPPQSGLAHTVIETEAWGRQKTVIAFYDTEFKISDRTEQRVVGYIFLPRAPNTGTATRQPLEIFRRQRGIRTRPFQFSDLPIRRL